jgi:hypothetical protein
MYADTQLVVRCPQDTECKARVICNQIIMKYTHGECCDTLLTVDTCNNLTNTAEQEYVLRYPGRCNPMPMCFDDYSMVSVEQKLSHLWHT